MKNENADNNHLNVTNYSLLKNHNAMIRPLKNIKIKRHSINTA